MPPSPAGPGHTLFPPIQLIHTPFLPLGLRHAASLLWGWVGAWPHPPPSPQVQGKFLSPAVLHWGWPAPCPPPPCSQVMPAVSTQMLDQEHLLDVACRWIRHCQSSLPGEKGWAPLPCIKEKQMCLILICVLYITIALISFIYYFLKILKLYSMMQRQKAYFYLTNSVPTQAKPFVEVNGSFARVRAFPFNFKIKRKPSNPCSSVKILQQFPFKRIQLPNGLHFFCLNNWALSSFFFFKVGKRRL